MIRLAVVIAAAGLLAGTAAAQQGPAPIRGLAACQAIADHAQRLACFDREAALLVSAVEKKETVVLDQQEIRRTKRSLFGFSLPRLPFFEGADKASDAPEAAEFTQIEAPIRTVTTISYGRFRFSVDEGALWETSEGLNAFPKVGQKVVIRKGLMGSYFIRFEGARSVKGRRVG